MAQRVTNRWLKDAVATALSGTIKAALYNGGTINPDADFMSDLDGTEVSTTGYASGYGGAGRVTLANVTFTQDETNDKVVMDCDDFTITNIGVPAGVAMTKLVVYLHAGGSDAAAKVIAQFDAVLSLNGGNAAFTINASGLWAITL